MSNRKICFIISSLRRGGAERVVSLLSSQFSKTHSCDISIITINPSSIAYELGPDISLYDLKIGNDKNPVLNSIERVSKIISKLREIKPDIVISFMTATNCEAIVCSKLLGIPIIVSERSNPCFSCTNTFWKIFRRLSYPMADMLVCQTLASMKHYTYVRRKQVIYNPVREFSLRGNVRKLPVILSVGTLKKEKGFDLLIEAFSRVNPHQRKNWRLVIVGEGVERNRLAKLAQERGVIDSVDLPGATSDVERYYRSSSIFVLSSRFEGMPNALIEAMSAGLACISFSCDYGPAELISDGQGILVKAEDVDALATKITELIGDVKRRVSFGEAAQLKAREHSVEAITSQWATFINEIIFDD